MKLLRPILLTVGVVFVLGLLTVSLALNPSIQRWVILRAAAKQPDLHFQLDGISAGLSGATLQGVRLERRGIRVSFKQLTTEYSLWAFLADRHVQLGKLNVRGLVVDASRLSRQKTQAGLAGAPAAAPGALAGVHLPWELTLDGLDIQGRVILTGEGEQLPLQGDFQVQGGKIGPGRDGELHLLARVKDPARNARVALLDIQASLQLRESFARTFDHINLSSVLDASGPSLIGKNQLKLAVEMNRVASGEKYHVTVDTLRAGQGENVLALNADHSPASAAYTGDWSVSAGSAQLESFLLGHILPKFTANGSGRFEFTPHPAVLTLQGSLQGDVAEFEKLRPELGALGTLRIKSDFDVTVDPAVLHVRKLSVEAASEHPVLALRTTGPLDFNLPQHRLESAGATRGEILRLKLTEVPLAWVTPFCPAVDISGGPITGELALAQGEGDQFTVVSVTPLQAGGVSVTKAGRKLLTKVEITMDAEAELSPARTLIKVRSVSLRSGAGDLVEAKLLLTAPSGLHLPLAAEGDFSAELPALLTPLLPAAGPFKAKGSIDFSWLGEHLEVRRLNVESSGPSGELLGSLAVTRPFTLDLAHGWAETGAPNDRPLATVKVGQMPLLSLPHIYAGYSVSGRMGPAEATLSARGTKLTLRATAPVPILDFSLLQQKKRVLDRLKLILQPTVEFNDGAFTQMQTGAVTLENAADVSLAELNAEITQGDAGLRAVSTFDFDLPAWSSQPGRPGLDALSSGQVKGELRAALAGNTAQIEARATANNLIAGESGQTLPVANLNLRANIDATGHFSLRMPVLLDRAGLRSDMDFSADGTASSGGVSFDAKLQSDHIELRDMLMLLAVAGSPLAAEGPDSTSAQSRALSPPAADQTAFWSGTTGQVSVECKSIVSGRDWTMTGLSGRLLVQNDRLVLEKLEAAYDDTSRFSAKGSLVFEPGLDPYQLAGNFSLTEFDAGRFLKAMHPDQPPMLEGLFSVKGELGGHGLNFDDTVDRTFGTFDFMSRKGVFRGLKRSTDKISMASKAVVLVSSLLGDRSAEKLASGAYNIEQLAQELGELNFDQFTVRLSRDPSLNLKLENFTLISQQIHFLGSGKLTYVAGKPLGELPLDATLSLRARDKSEEILGKLKVLDGTRDELGYAKVKEAVILGGTLVKPDPTPFYVRLAAGRLTDSSASEK